MTKTKKRVLKISALVLALVLIAGVAWFACSLLGNPVSSLLARGGAKKYVEANYPGTDYVVDYRGYDFKSCDYYAYVSSPSKIDEHFGIYMDGLGRVVRDGYTAIESKYNVASRLGNDYRNRANALFDSPAFRYETDISYGDLEFDERIGLSPSPNAVTRAELENNRAYDVAALGRTNGELVLYIIDTDASHAHLAEILLYVREYFDAARLPFYRINLVLRSPRDAEGVREDVIRLDSFLYESIYEDGLADRISAHIEAHKEADAETHK